MVTGGVAWACARVERGRRVHQGLELDAVSRTEHRGRVLPRVRSLVEVLHLLPRVRVRRHAERAEAEVARRIPPRKPVDEGAHRFGIVPWAESGRGMRGGGGLTSHRSWFSRQLLPLALAPTIAAA